MKKKAGANRSRNLEDRKIDLQNCDDFDGEEEVPVKRGRFLPGGLDEIALADVNDFFTQAFDYGGVGEYC